MKFRISREKTISWQNKCVWCGDKPIMKYPVVGKGFLGTKVRIFGRGYDYEFAKVEVEYPVCRKHYFWSMGMQIAYLVSWVGMVLGLIVSIYLALLFAEWFVFYFGMLFCILIAAMFILAIILQPVRLRWVRRHFYTMIIRNEDYAREFALLNNLNPI